MKDGKKLLIAASETLDLPVDIIAGLPRMEIIGVSRFTIEPHNGLLAYSEEQVIVECAVGRIMINGKGLNIKQMNRERLSVSGIISSVVLREAETIE